MGQIIFIVGGARSGKSSWAEKLANEQGKKLLYLATAQAKDDEMHNRIKRHQKRRGNKWQLIEEPIDLVRAIKKISRTTDILLIDCVTLWLSNLMLAGWSESKTRKAVKELLNVLVKINFKTILVSNEVGQGIVPVVELGRKYRDLLGLVNQQIAKEAAIVYQMCCGLPLRIKGGRCE